MVIAGVVGSLAEDVGMGVDAVASGEIEEVREDPRVTQYPCWYLVIVGTGFAEGTLQVDTAVVVVVAVVLHALVGELELLNRQQLVRQGRHIR